MALLVIAGCGRFGFGEVTSADARDDAAPSPIDASATLSWRQQSPGQNPGQLLSPKLAYHPSHAAVYLYSGSTTVAWPGTPITGMWRYTASAGWQVVCDPCPPGPRWGPGFAYDASRDRLVLYGGNDTTQIRSDTWEWDGTSWLQISTPQTAGPRENATLVYDAGRGRLLLIGGSDGAAPDASVHEYSGTWTQVGASGGPLRINGFGVNAAYDPDADRILVYSSEDKVYEDELWAWNGDWTLVCAACTGQVRTHSSIIYDPPRHRLLLVGGFTGAGEITGTWELRGTAFQQISDQPPARDSTGLVRDVARDTIVLFGGNGASCGFSNCDETWELSPP